MTVLIDMHRLGPAPTWERELAAAAANLVVTLLVAGVLLLGFGRAGAALPVTLVLFGWITARMAAAARRDRGER